MPSSSERAALVFGASGISGWRVLNELLTYPEPTTFDSVIGASNRPLSKQDALLPDDPRLQLVSGVDLTSPLETVITTIKEKITNIAQVTHVYFYAYVHSPKEGQSVFDANVKLLENTLLALKELSPKLQHFILQTGAKYYGIEAALINGYVVEPTPWKESFRLPEPYASQTFYYKQLDVIAEHAKGASWKWTEVRPDGIVGFAPVPNPMNIGLALAVFFSLWRAVHGKGASVPYPGSPLAYSRTNTESLMSASARFQIFASLKGDETNGQAYNVGAPRSTYAEKWPQLAAVHGLVGAAPTSEETFDVGKWALEHKDVWLKLEKEHGLKEGVLESTGFWFLFALSIPFNRDLDISKLKEVGFTEEFDVIGGYKEAWSLMVKARFIPPF